MIGAEKYEDDWQWRGEIDWTRVYDAAQRHQQAWLSGETIDPESKLPHLAHAAWGLLALSEHSRLNPGKDDRVNQRKWHPTLR